MHRISKMARRPLVELSSIPVWAEAARKLPAPDSDCCFFSASDDVNQQVSVWLGDSTTLHVDAIMNAANRSLLGGGGIDGAIHRAAGPKLVEECRTLGGARTGESKITRAYNLPCRYVIHTVGPIGEQPELLEKAYSSFLEVVERNGIRTAGLCCISTGAFGYPLVSATHIALRTVRKWLDTVPFGFERLVFVVYQASDLAVYERLMPLYFPPTHPRPRAC